MLGMVSERSRIGRALQLTFHLFSRNFRKILSESFCVAGAVFDEFGQ